MIVPVDYSSCPAHFFTAILIVFTLSLCLIFTTESYSQDVDSNNLDDVVLQLKWKHQFQFAGYYAAKEKGYYRDAGLDVTIREAPENMASSEPVLSGDAQFGVTGTDLLLIRNSGEPVVALAVIFQHSPMVLLARKDSEISSVHDLRDKLVMMEYPNAELRAYLEYEQLTEDTYTEVLHSFSPDALVNGEVDAISAYVTDEPFVLQEASIEYLIFSPMASSIDFYGDLLYTTEDQIRNYPERVRAFREASLRGWDYALRNREEIADLILSDYSLRHSREHLLYEAEQMERLIRPDLVTIGYMYTGRWRYIADTYASLGMLPENIDLSGFLYNQEVDQDLGWFFLILLSSLFTLGIVSFAAYRFYSMNRQTQIEVHERIRAEKKVTALLREKEILLLEVHHRVKNNMSIMISLLSLQADELDDEPGAASLKDACRRLKTMSVLYDKLYLSSGLQMVSVRAYLGELSREVIDLYPVKAVIKLETDIEEFSLSVDRITSVGIIVNEIITNSLKYAFEDRSEGLITIQSRCIDGDVSIVVSDDGQGMPDSTGVEGAKGFGMKLLQMLTEQLDGSMRIESTDGTKYILNFKA